MLTVNEIGQAVGRAKALYQNPENLVNELSSVQKAKEGVTTEQRKKWLIENHANRQELSAAVLTNIQTDVLAHLFALGFLQEVTLGTDQWPILTTDKRDKYYRCTYLGEDGVTIRKQRVPRRAHVQHLLQKFATEEVEYPLMNIQTGDVSELDRVQNELAYELKLNIDVKARALLDAGVLSSGLRATLNLHDSVVAANIPDKNYYDESGTNSGILTITKLKNLLDYFVRFANDVEIDGTPLQIKTIYMSSTMVKHIWDFVTLVAGYTGSGFVDDPTKVVPTAVQDGIYTSGRLNQLFGYPINIVARNTITAPFLYISSNKPAGFFWRKPMFDEIYYNQEASLRKKNLGAMSMSSVFAMAIPSEWTYRYLKVKC